MVELFVSYSRSDKVFIKDFIRHTRRRYGVNKVWYDKKLKGGDKWWEKILGQIEQCTLFVYFISNESLKSEYCQKELRHALKHKKQIIPVVVRRLNDDYPGKIAEDLRLELKDTHYVDLQNGFNEKNARAELWSSIDQFIQPLKIMYRTLISTTLLIYFLVTIGILLISNNTATFASTPEPSQEPVSITENQTPEATEESPPEPISRPPLNGSLLRCAIEDETPINAVELTFFIDEDSFILHLDAGQPDANLSQLGFEFTNFEGERRFFCLRELGNLEFLENSTLPSPSCLLLVRESNTSPLPNACPNDEERLIDISLHDADIFWHERSFLVLNGNEQVDFCGTPRSRECKIDLSDSLPPVIDEVEIHLAWEADYLAIYIEETGLFNLDGLRITHDSDEEGRILQEDPAFASLRFDEIRGPICFYYTTRDSETILPDGCDASRRIIQYVSASGVFWHVNHSNRVLYVFVDDEAIGNFCFNTGICTRWIP